MHIKRGKYITNNPWGIFGEQTYEQFINGFIGGPSDGSYSLNEYLFV